MIYNKTLLYQGSANVSSVTLTESVANFERIQILAIDGEGNSGVLFEIPSITNVSNMEMKAANGYYSSDVYMQKFGRISISADGKTINITGFNILGSSGTTPYYWGNSTNNANNRKQIARVYGINRINGEQTVGQGKPSKEWDEYNEYVLWSGSNTNEITLNDSAFNYKRLKIKVGTNDTAKYYYEVETPQTDGELLTIQALSNESDSVYNYGYSRWFWSDNMTKLTSEYGKSYRQTGTGNGNATNSFNVSDTDFIKRPILEIRGIIKKQVLMVNVIETTGGTTIATPTSGYRNDLITLSSHADEGYNLYSYKVDGATLTGDTFKLKNSNVIVTPQWYNSETTSTLSLTNDGNGTVDASVLTGHVYDTSTLSTTANEGYVFDKFVLTNGGSIQDNIYTFGVEDGIVEALFKIPSAILYRFDGEYTGNVFGTTDVSNAPYDYIAIKFDYRNTAPSYGAGGWQILFNNASWRTRYRHGQGNHTLLKQQPYQYVNTATVGWYNADSTNNYYSKLYNCTDYHPIKLLCHKNVGDVSSFVENIYHGHQALNVSLTSLTFTQYNETSVSHTAKNVEIASFNTLEEAVNWS